MAIVDAGFPELTPDARAGLKLAVMMRMGIGDPVVLGGMRLRR